jgi:hypothetical protein
MLPLKDIVFHLAQKDNMEITKKESVILVMLIVLSVPNLTVIVLPTDKFSVTNVTILNT